MADNEIDQMTQEIRQLGHAAGAAIANWQRRNPGKTKVPRKVRKESTRQLRESMRAYERWLAEERQWERMQIEQSIDAHRYWSLEMHKNPGTPEQFAKEQWEQAHHRYTVTQQIHQARHLTVEERGQAVMALVSAHYADNPKVPHRPVWGPKPYGMSALKARLAEQVSRTRDGLEHRRVMRDQRRSVRATRMRAPAAPGSAAQHPFWTAQVPQQDQAMNARMAQMEAQLRDLAQYRDHERGAIAERDQLQTKVTQLGEKLLDARQQHKTVADQLAQRGRELTDVHAELERVRGERDAAVQKLVARTPHAQRYGSPQRQTEQAKAATPKAPETPEQPEAPEAPERQLVGATASNGHAVKVVNGSRKVPGSAAPEIPLPPEPSDGLEPPEFNR
ncbi:hypothetical protein [Nocardia nova]|uniref:hypothetical protein n=1 Tax=Nocardia nova TaxID=37330 RepID=UPI0018949CBB|nr:hypothetical protein [Nocardia nova]MBF6150286.1 hypothetical protein [Nocardia nova]